MFSALERFSMTVFRQVAGVVWEVGEHEHGMAWKGTGPNSKFERDKAIRSTYKTRG